MKSRVKNLLIAASASLMAVFLGLGAVVQKPVGSLGPAADNRDSGKSVIDVTDALGSQIASQDMLNGDLLSQAKVKSDGTRNVIVELEADSMLDVYLEDSVLQTRYGEFSKYVNAAEGRAYSDELLDEQSAFISALGKSLIDYTIRHTYTSVINGLSLSVDADDVEALEKMNGVKSVIYSESYAVPQVEPTMNEVKVFDTGIYDSSDTGYSGEGMLVAVLDTGFDRSHSAFQEMPPEGTEKLSKQDVTEKFSELTATTHGVDISVDDVYYNTKVPFAYDYADGDSDVFPKASSHGHHVAGIIAGKDESVTAADGEAFENGETFRGVAPDAQLMICKVFPDEESETNGGAETDNLLAALSDCITLGADVINMSLGVSAGFSREEDGNAINTVYDKVYEAGINLVVAASNEGSSAQNGAYGSTNLTSNPDSGTVGSPSTYAGALSVASISGQLSSYLELDTGAAIYFNESANASGTQGDFVAEILDSIGKDLDRAELNFVVVPGYGYQYNYSAAIREKLAEGNCIAVVSRGENNFEDKQRIAYDNGAIACIIYNNVSGRISASLGTGKKIPTCTVTADMGAILKSASSGKIVVDRNNKAGPFMSEFSSWGPTSDLKIKPEITAHGGEITSSVVGGYNIYSGTSMASPNMAGAVALLRQHVHENYGLEGLELADRVNQLLMSTATIVEDERGLPYSVRKQGAGLGDIGKAIASDAYLSVANSTKPKLELGDDPSRRGVYTMEFDVNNASNSVKTYDLDAIVMTESVSIDGITVAEQSYMLDDAVKTYYVNGSRASGSSVTVQPNDKVTVKVTVSLTAADKDYLDANFENGMYVEGYITLADQDAEGTDLSIPYLAFYGDWLDAPIFDKTAYEVSSDKFNTAIEDEDKAVAAIYETVAIGRYYKGTDTYIPLGQYVYDVENDGESGIETMVDKIAVGNSEYGIYEFYAVYFGMFRAVEEMEVVITDSVTGEVVWRNTIDKVNKAYGSSPAYAEIGISPYELGLKNNTKYNVDFTACTEYNGRKSEAETQHFTFYVDYEAPILYENTYNVRFEYDTEDNTLRHAYLDLNLYDNHYVESVQLFTYAEAESNVDWATDDVGTVDWLTEYSIPVDSERGAVNKVTVEITDWLDQLMNVEGETEKFIGVRIDDYALNSAAYLVSVEFPEVSKVDVEYTYRASGGDTTVSLENSTVVMAVGNGLDLTEDTGSVILASGETVRSGEFEVKLYNYATYSCASELANGGTCEYVYDEHVGLTYSKGDYYYDKTSGKVLQKTADDTQPTYPAGTLFTDIIATYNNSEYVSNHFVCPKCGSEVTFTYNSRSDKLTPDNYTKISPDAMTEEVIWKSSDESVVRVWNGRLYAQSEGEATIYAYAPDAAIYPYPMDADPDKVFSFKVKVEGTSGSGSARLEGLGISSYDNLTLGTSRSVSGDYISVENGTKLVLYPKFEPWYVQNIKGLSWLSADPDVLEIIESDDSSATVLCKEPAPGGVQLMLMAGGYSYSLTIYIGNDFELVNNMYFYEYNGPGYTEEVYFDADGNYTSSDTLPEGGEARKVLVVPANLGITNFGYVMSTREGPFYQNQDIDTVIVPEGVTNLGLSCFMDSSIRRIYLPSTLIYMAANVFSGCENLEEVYWYDASEDSGSGIVYDPDNNSYNWDVFFEEANNTKVTSQSVVIGGDGFYNCVRLREMDFERIVAVYAFAFENCLSLTGTIDLTDLRFSETGIFMGCSGITGVKLGENTVLAPYMFSGTGITSVNYPGDKVGSGVFANMKKLTSVTFGGAVTIGSRAFEGCSALETVNFNGACYSIGSYAFADTAIEKLELPTGLASIGSYAFQNCASLKEINFDSTIKLQTIGADVFRGCSSLAKLTLDGESEYYVQVNSSDGTQSMLVDKSTNEPVLVPPAYNVSLLAGGQSITIGSGFTSIGAQSYANNASLSGKELVIANGVKSIGAQAFAGTGITKVVIPASVTEIGEDAFAYCDELQSVVILGNISAIPSGLFRGCGSLESIQIPDSVSVIGDDAFNGTALKSLEIGRNVVSIGNNAFAGSSLQNLTFAKNSNLVEIGDGAFKGCADITELTLPDSVTVIGESAFEDCTSLRVLYVSASTEKMGARAFADASSLESITFGDGAKAVGDYAFYTSESSSLQSVTLPESVAEIGEYAFAETALVSVSLPGVINIGSHAFYNAASLKTADVSEKLSYVGVSAFEGSAIENIELSGIEYFDARSFYKTNVSDGELTDAIEIGNEAFYNCRSFTSLNLPNAEQIYASAFYVPKTDESGNFVTGSISRITLGDKLLGLGGGAFFNSRIRTIDLPASLSIIGAPAFSGCSSLISITVDADNEVFFTDDYGGLYKHLSNGGYELVSVPNGLDMSDVDNLDPYVILEGTVRVGDWAMAYCDDIHAVRIPASVQAIGSYGFYYMGMAIVTQSGVVGNLDDKVYPKYIFEGLQAPVLETDYSSDEAASIMNMYFNFSNQVGYLVNDFIVPANAKGFDSSLYEMFCRDMQYSEERIESGTQTLLDWLIALDVESLTLDDAETVELRNRAYNNLTDGQKAFLSEYAYKLTDAMNKISELRGETVEPDLPETPDQPETPAQPEEGGCGSVSYAGIAGVLCAAVLAAAALMVVRHKKSNR